jgi:hypothetical protein
VTELSGSLEGIGLVALVRFLTTVARSGRLVVSEGSLRGSLDLEDGALVGAAFDQEQGLPALEAIALALGNGRFEFHDAAEAAEHNVRLAAGEVEQQLEKLAREQVVLAAAVPSLSGIPYVNLDEAADNGQVALDRDTLRLLIQLDGRRTVFELARDRGLLRTLRQLAQLVQLGLARIEVSGLPRAPEPPPRLEPVRHVEPPAASHPPPTREPTPSTPPSPPVGPAGSPPGRVRPPSGETAWSRWRRPPPNTPGRAPDEQH